jgi:hypothetical protein
LTKAEKLAIFGRQVFGNCASAILIVLFVDEEEKWE